MARKLLGNKAGESLVELAVSIAILSLIVLWAMSAFGAYAKTGQDLDSVGQAIALADSKIELLKADTLTQLNTDLSVTGTWQDFAPANNFQYRYTRISPDKTTGAFTLVEVVLDIGDRSTTGIVYTVKTSFLRGGEQNVGD
jgi:type II secretory pathway pseudopilin PulG